MSGNRSRLYFVEYDEFESSYATFSVGQPNVFTVTPDYKIAFNRRLTRRTRSTSTTG
jgi:hypothetical protein